MGLGRLRRADVLLPEDPEIPMSFHHIWPPLVYQPVEAQASLRGLFEVLII